MKTGKLLSILCLACLASGTLAQAPDLAFVTLGTASGPVGVPDRSQPANALIVGDRVFLVDAGDGTFGQLAKAGISPALVDGLFISHLHFDHTGGVLAILSLRAQVDNRAPFAIYGPPGTQAFTDGLVDAMAPALNAGFGLPGQTWQTNITVQEMRDGERVTVNGMTVTAAENSHYDSAADTADTPGFISLSFRFETASRSIVYTGDTGPSAAVTALAGDADLLVSEMMDIPAGLERITRLNPAIAPQALVGLEAHFTMHHVTPEQVATMAAEAGVDALVITHFAPGITSPDQAQEYRHRMERIYAGPIRFANDLDRF